MDQRNEQENQDQVNQGPQQAPQEQQPYQESPSDNQELGDDQDPAENQPPVDIKLTKPAWFVLGGLFVFGLAFFYQFLQNTNRPALEARVIPTVVTPTAVPTQVVRIEDTPVPTHIPLPTHPYFTVEDTVYVTAPAGWKAIPVSQNAPLTMNFTSSDYAANPDNSVKSGARFSISIAPNKPVMTARERITDIQKPAPGEEPYYDHQMIGDEYGLYNEFGSGDHYVVANDKYYWHILFECNEACNAKNLRDREALVDSIQFRKN